MEQSGKRVTANGQDSANPSANFEPISAVVNALYETISGPQGAPRDWDRFRSLFIPGARMIPQHRAPAGPLQVMDIDAYITRATKAFETMSFYETEAAARIETFGCIAHVFSTYESRYSPGDPQPFMRGINSIQLHCEDGCWRVASVAWDVEDDENPIPVQYLPHGRNIR